MYSFMSKFFYLFLSQKYFCNFTICIDYLLSGKMLTLMFLYIKGISTPLYFSRIININLIIPFTGIKIETNVKSLHFDLILIY